MSTRFDEVVEQAWDRFEEQLVAELQRLHERGRLRIALEDDEGVESGWLCFHAHDEFRGEDGVEGEEGEVLAQASGNHFLPTEHRLDQLQEQALAALGWHEPEPDVEANWGHLSSPEELPALGSMVVATLRQVFGVVHPRFLSGDLADEPDPDDDQDEVAEPRGEEDEELVVVFPESGDELRDQVARVLRARVDDPEPDEDGDFGLRGEGGARVWVCPTDSAPVVRLWAVVVHDVRRWDQARRETNVLNRQALFVRFHLDDDTVVVESEVPATPLVGTHLIDQVDRLFTVVSRQAADLAERLDAVPAGQERSTAEHP